MIRLAALAGMSGVLLASFGIAWAESPPAAVPPVHHANSHHHRPAHTARPVVATLPVRNTPVASAVPVAGPAPVPNEAVTAPIDNPSPETKVAPSVFSLHYPNQGDGYVTGSSPQAMDDRNAARATGVEMKVPLPQ